MKSRSSFLRRSPASQFAVLCVLIPGLVIQPVPMRGNPTGGMVVNGAIEIGDGLGGQLSISQASQKGIINWEDFSIGAGEVTQFLQPSADSSTLNRVISGNPSAIQGALKANGKIFVINPNGIMVGPGGSIDVAGLVMSTLDVSDAEYLAGGDMIFRGTSSAGVQNFGRINAIGGDVFLIGKTVENAGSISASGTVGLAAGEEVLITASPDANGERVFVKPVGSGGAGTGVTNSGSIQGAAVELKAHGNLYALAINNSGSIRATGAARSGGGVYLRAPGGQVDNTGSIAATLPGGNGGRILIEGAIINAGGTIDASATTEQGQGGEVTLSGETINVTGKVAADGGVGGLVTIGGEGTQSVSVGNGAEVSANGSSGAAGTVIVTGAEVAIGDASIAADGFTAGGEVNVGGGFQGGDESIANAINTVVSDAATISANALGDGNAGQVVIWADGQTDYAGTITAEAKGVGNGGLVEVSGA
ncbi:MAG: filamentous hemagglutinin N-terminal domain-containing protein, partial [Verrucomicrobiae bacterium]|nr:filamentous hemagglutinin N-terminal domain-containing protein [Verrucomicrobiae bacterium]